jgi:hypothetical protein
MESGESTGHGIRKGLPRPRPEAVLLPGGVPQGLRLSVGRRPQARAAGHRVSTPPPRPQA